MKRKRISRKGTEYRVTVRWKSKPMKHHGAVIPPGHGFAFDLGTAACTLINTGTFTYAHVAIRKIS